MTFADKDDYEDIEIDNSSESPFKRQTKERATWSVGSKRSTNASHHRQEDNLLKPPLAAAEPLEANLSRMGIRRSIRKLGKIFR